MPLQGTFDVLDFSEVLRLLARQQLTGRLHVRSRSFGANLFLEEGSLVGADQTEHQAAAAAGDVRGRLEEICFEMLDAERGGFEFQPGRPSTLPSTTKLRVDTVLSRARKRLQEWQEMQELIPSLDLQPHLVDDLASNEVTIDQERWRMLTVVDGRRSLRAIGRTLNLSDFDVCRVVISLLEEGIIELDARAKALASAAREAVAPPVATPDSPAVHEVVRVTDRSGGSAAAQPANGKSTGQAAPGRTAVGVASPGEMPTEGPAAGGGEAGSPISAGDPAADPTPAASQEGPDASGAAEEAGETSPALTATAIGAPTTPGAHDTAGAAAAGDTTGAHDPAGAAGADDTTGGAGPGAAPTEPATANASPGEAGESEGPRGRRRRVVRIRSRTTPDDDA